MNSRDAVVAALRDLRLAAPDETPELTELSGGISSEIYRVELAGRVICVKRALATLKTDPDWHVPVARSGAEWGWLKLANEILPGAAPAVLGYDQQRQLLVLEYLDPAAYPIWKEQLRDGVIEPATAQGVAANLARLHNHTAGRDDLATAFANDAVFHAIRLEAYFLAAAERTPAAATRLRDLVEQTAAAKCALVHGDISPKNILVGAAGPVFLDAECAWYGEPAFDAAFCLTHLLLKGIWRGVWIDRYLECYSAFGTTYLAAVAWLPAAEVERRVTRLLAGMVLARVRGRSKVEYITEPALQDRIAEFAVGQLTAETASLAVLAGAWRETFKDG